MARTESRIQGTIWTDNDDFRALSAREQWMYLFLVTQPTINLCGILPLTIKSWSHAARGETEGSICENLVGLSSIELHADRTNEPFVIIDYETEELWVRSFIKNDRVCRNRFTRQAAWTQVTSIRSARLRALARTELEIHSAVALEEGAVAPQAVEPSLGSQQQFKGLCDNPLRESPPPSPSPASSNSPSPPPWIAEGKALLVKPLREPPDGGGEAAPHQNKKPLVERLAQICTGVDRDFVAAEAAMVVAWAKNLDQSKIEEVIDYASRWKDPPVVPRAVAKALAGRAREAGIPLKPFKPKKTLEPV